MVGNGQVGANYVINKRTLRYLQDLMTKNIKHKMDKHLWATKTFGSCKGQTCLFLEVIMIVLKRDNFFSGKIFYIYIYKVVMFLKNYNRNNQEIVF